MDSKQSASLKYYHSHKDKCRKACSQYHKSHRQQIANRHKLRAWENKQDFVKYKGGKCSICGYSKCIASLEFHHINPKLKDHSVSHYLAVRSLDSVKQELDKCILVCSNCHREVHWAEMQSKTREVYK